jgi:hypothetical protein
MRRPTVGALRGMGLPRLFLPLGQASSTGLRGTVKPNIVHHFSIFLFSFTISGIHINFENT